MFDVEANGNHYQEMHVDGGTVSQAFLVPPSVNIHVAYEKAGFMRKVASPKPAAAASAHKWLRRRDLIN